MRDFAMRLAFQFAIWVAALMTPLAGSKRTLVVAGVLVVVTGVLAMLWGRRAPELMRVGGGATG